MVVRPGAGSAMLATINAQSAARSREIGRCPHFPGYDPAPERDLHRAWTHLPAHSAAGRHEGIGATITNERSDKTPLGESVVVEVRAIRERIDAECGHDVRRVAERARRESAELRARYGLESAEPIATDG